MDVFEKAIIFATQAHMGQKRKNGQNFITHPMEVAVIANKLTDDRQVLAAAMLHDCVEDCDVGMEQIKEEFGANVARLVASETENKMRGKSPKETWKMRKVESLEVLANCDDIRVKILWLSDKLANISSFYKSHKQFGDSFWQNFNQSDLSEQHWYYNEVLKLTEELSHTDEWKEFKQKVLIVFENDIK